MGPCARLGISIAGLAGAMAITGCGPTSASGRSTDAPAGSQGIALAECMRSHGLREFPDPLPGHAMQFDLPPGLNPRSPAFRSAQAACRNVLPAPPKSSGGGVSAAQKATALKYALCMRSHGVPNYPDPTYKNGRPTELPLSNYGIDPSSPAFVTAAKRCLST